MKDYSKREIDFFMEEIKETLERIEAQTVRTNGRVTRLERCGLIVGTALGILIVTNFPEVLKFVIAMV